MLVELEQCNCRTGIFHINACVPSLADDVSCTSTSPKTSQCMLDVCNEYSRKWCFRFNAKTSYILQFSLSPPEKNLIYNWHIGDGKIPSSDNCCHLGIEMNSRFKATERATNACRKGRNAFFATNGIMSKSTKPCILVKLYKSIVLPTVLYGCEMWNNLKSVDLTNLNRFQHFIVKRIQNLRTCTRSDMCQS